MIYIEAISGPSHYNLGIGISYQGVGFKHDLGCSNQAPTTQQEVDEILEHFLKVATEFENTLLPTIDALYPETPSWFVPSD